MTIIAQKVIELIHNHADQLQNEVVLSFDQSLLSSFSLFLLPISFHLNFEALVPRLAALQNKTKTREEVLKKWLKVFM